MIAAALACSALLVVEVPASDVSDATRTEYRAAAAAAGRDADAHVRLAVWCEARGMAAERLKHLGLAALADPSHATARGLMGLVRVGDAWVRPDQAAAKVERDAKTAASLAEYNRLRARSPRTADGHWKLAAWCEKNGLDAEAKAHLTAVTRLDPARESAWIKLGCRKHHGRWMTAEQIAAQIAEAEAQKKSDRFWGPQLARWKDGLGPSRRREEAESGLAGVTDPRAVPSVLRLFAAGGPADQMRAVQLLGQIEGVPASKALATLAVTGASDAVRRAATETLLRRDPREFVGLLVERLRTPVKVKAVDPDQPEGVGSLVVEDEDRVTVRRYTAQVVDRPGRSSPNRQVVASPVVGGDRGTAAARTAEAAMERLRSDKDELERRGAMVRAANAPLLQVLSPVTGRDFGDRADAWRTWWADTQGFAYASRTSTPRAIRYEEFAYEANLRPSHSCFAAGTSVWTLAGARPIESLAIGDRVLCQDATTGALGYQAILGVFHNPPAPTLKVALDSGDAVVATGIHRFWKAGKGWTMARDLKPGDRVRVVGGSAKVVAVEPDSFQNVFNLEVARGHSFFVGRAGALVHDNSLVEPTTAPFDAPRRTPPQKETAR